MKLLKKHLVHSFSARLVTEHVGHPAQLLWDSGGPSHGAGYGLVPLDLPGVEDLAHVEVHPEADRDEVGEEKDKAEHVDIPGTVETFQHDHHKSYSYSGEEQHFRDPIQLLVQ